MNAEEVLRKADAGESLTVEEVMVYERTVKPIKHVYGKFGTLANCFLLDFGQPLENIAP